jgi:hypothetical protein
MAMRVKAITLWRRDVEDRRGVLAETLEPLAKAGADLEVLMGYRHPGDPQKASIELYPVAGKKAAAAAASAGLSASSIPALLVEGDNRAGAAHRTAQAIADAGINLDFFLAQVVGRRYSAVLGFENEADAKRAATLIKRAGTPKKK